MRFRRFIGGVVTAALLGTGAVAAVAVVAAPAQAAVARSTIVANALSELNNATRNKAGETNGDGPCNFYTGYFRTWKKQPCQGSSSGIQWRGSDWCADFVKYVWATSGVAYASKPETSQGVLTGWASSIKDYGVKFGTWHTRASSYVPQPGDALVFDTDLDGDINHTGIVTSFDGTTVRTVEGNSGSPSQTRAHSYGRDDARIIGFTAPFGVGAVSKKYWVDTFRDAPGYNSTSQTNWTGTLFAGTNYVYCKAWGNKIQEGSAYNHWWLLTDLDEGSPWQNQWVSAYYLSRWGNDEAKDNSGVVIPDC